MHFRLVSVVSEYLSFFKWFISVFTLSCLFYDVSSNIYFLVSVPTSMRDVPKVMSNFFLHANWEQQTKESAVIDGTSCCVILECLMTSIACIT